MQDDATETDDVSGSGRVMVLTTALAVGAFEARIGRKRLFLWSVAAGAIWAVVYTVFDSEVVDLVGGLAGFLGLVGAGTALVTRLLYRRAWQPAIALGVIGLGWTLGAIVAGGLLLPSR